MEPPRWRIVETCQEICPQCFEPSRRRGLNPDHSISRVRRDEVTKITDWESCAAVERSPGKVGGVWVFAGERIPLLTLYENLARGATIKEFVEWFPGVDEQQVRAVLEHETKALRVAVARRNSRSIKALRHLREATFTSTL